MYRLSPTRTGYSCGMTAFRTPRPETSFPHAGGGVQFKTWRCLSPQWTCLFRTHYKWLTGIIASAYGLPCTAICMFHTSNVSSLYRAECRSIDALSLHFGYKRFESRTGYQMFWRINIYLRLEEPFNVNCTSSHLYTKFSDQNTYSLSVSCLHHPPWLCHPNISRTYKVWNSSVCDNVYTSTQHVVP